MVFSVDTHPNDTLKLLTWEEHASKYNIIFRRVPNTQPIDNQKRYLKSKTTRRWRRRRKCPPETRDFHNRASSLHLKRTREKKKSNE